MTILEAAKVHEGALILDQAIARRYRRMLRRLFFWFAIIGALYSGAAFFVSLPFMTMAGGVALVLAASWGSMFVFEAYYNTYYFFGLNSIIGLDDRKVTGVAFEVAQTVLGRAEDDLTAAFATSSIGFESLLRVGITQDVIDTYLAGERTRLRAGEIKIDHEVVVRMETLGQLLLQRDPSFEPFLAAQGVQSEQFLGALRWVAGSIRTQKRHARWWSKDRLSKTQSIGSELSYGQAYHLERFTKDIRSSAVFSVMAVNSAYAMERVEEIESTLARTLSANVLLVGEAGVGKMDLLMEVGRRMATGEALQAIAGKHMVVLDTGRIFGLYDNKQDIENAFYALFSEAGRIGNHIIVIENISTVLQEAAALDVQLPALLDQFLASTEMNVMVTDTPGGYHTYLEPLRAFTRRFEEILIDTPSVESTIRVLVSLTPAYEHSGKTLFTYQGLEAIAISAERYIVNGVMPDKAVQLMADVYAECVSGGLPLVTSDAVYKAVSEKTGMPVGPIEASEKETLLNLEDILHKKVIGQYRAISAIARTMRRARAGIATSERPIGSFLFLGPTGVGKTETAKALTSVFFKDEDAMNRLDMSEYSDEYALPRLIGTAENSGVLPDLLQERPYCVLLLDEFEKATESVHDLFLQILDEGSFTDGRGNTINAHNTIIIATSNAGSALIMNTIAQRRSLDILNAEIINHIIKEGIFKPELINRFDSTIIFEPLQESEQGAVAQLMLTDLTERIRDKGYKLELTPALLAALVHKGYSPEFGARPMRRLIQDLVEESVARKIIEGSLQMGSTITLDVTDFSSDALASTAGTAA